MKKWILLICILLCGCSKETEIETVVENNNNVRIALVYPTTNINKLDKIIKSYVDKTYQAFKDEYENFNTLATLSELNVDYQYWIVDNRYYNIVLTTFINNSSLAHPINEIETFVYDSKENKLLNINDFLGDKKFKKIIPTIKLELIKKYKDCILTELLDSEVNTGFKDILYAFKEDKITFYFNPYKVTAGFCNIINIDIPLSDLDIHFDKKTFEEKEYITLVNKTIDSNKKTVAITFDDGPSKYTSKIVDLLDQYDANGTFFVLGNKANIYKDTINKILKSGNEIGNHSYNHKWLTRLDIDSFKEQIEKTQNIVYDVSGYTPKYLRPTYGSINKKIRNNTDLEIVLWDVDSMDWKIKNSKTIANRVLKDVEDLDIILFHDTYDRTLKALEIIIPKLKEDGYQFVTISELLELKKIRKTV